MLLVEDDDDCRESIRELLEMEGLQVDAVSQAPTAISALSTRRPAIVLVDLRLGDGDGRTVIAHVRQTPSLAHLPVYVISGAVTEAAGLSKQGPERIDGFFEKPLNLPRLLSVIREVVGPRPAEA